MKVRLLFLLSLPLLLVMLTLAVLSGQGQVDSALAGPGDAQLRVAHASPDAPNVDVWVDGSVAFSDLPFKGVTGYAMLPAGDYLVQVEPAGAGGAGPFVISATLSLAADTDYTVAASDVLTNITPLVLVDDNSAPAAGNAHVRFVHLSPDAPAVDITLASGTVLISDVEFQEFSAYTAVPAGTYDLQVRLAGTSTVVLDLPGVDLADGSVYTAYAMGFAAGTPALEAVFSLDAGIADVRVAHASPDAPNVDVWVNGSIAFTDVAFTEITSYASLPNGSYLVQVEPTGSGGMGPFVISETLTLAAETDYTVAASDVLSNITPVVAVDDNTAPAPRQAHVRFFHLSPDAPPVDITLADGTVLFGNIAFQEASGYLPVNAGEYDLQVRLAGTSTVVLDVPDLGLRDGTVYTIFAMGLASGSPALQAIANPDSGNARVRVAHASPDAPNVDVWVDGAVAFPNVAFAEVTMYTALPFGSYLVQVEPAGAGGAGPFVISATLSLTDTDYTVAATDVLSNITPLILQDDNGEPALGNAHVRFVHASPDAPPVDITLTDGTVLFGNYAFQQASGYLPVGYGTYDLQVRLAGTSTVVLDVPGVVLEDGGVYTVFAMGLANGSPSLQAVPSLDAIFYRLAMPLIAK